MPIVKRSVKGSGLTNDEIDGNFDLLSSTPAAVSIVSDAVTLNGAGYYVIDTEGGAASDDLATINGLANGDKAEIVLANAGRTVRVRHNIGNIRLAGGVEFTLDSLGDSIEFRERSSVIYERNRTSVTT